MRAGLAVVGIFGVACAGMRYDRGPRALEQARSDVRVVDHRAPSELAVIEVAVRAGSAHDGPGREGLAYLTAHLLRQGGAGERTPEAVEAEIVGLGSKVEVVVDREVVSFRSTCLAEDAAAMAALLGDMLTAPGLDPEVFNRLRSESSAWLERGIVQDDEALGDAVLDAWLYEGHGYGHPTQGRLGVLEALTLDDVSAFLDHRYIRPAVVLGVAGGVSDSVVADLVTRLGETPGRLYDDVTPRAVPRVDGRSLLIVEKPTEATGIHFGHVTKLTRTHPDWPAMLLAVTALGEHRQSHGRLYQALREKRGLNYGDYAYIEDYVQDGWESRQQTGTGRVQNAFSVWIRPTQPANGPFALKAALGLVEAWVDQGLTPEEFARMQAYLASRIALWAADSSRRLGWATEAALMGWPNPITTLPDQIRALTLEQVNGAIQRHVDPDTLDIVVVTGDGSAFRAAVIEESASPIVYEGGPPDPASDQASEDAAIASTVVGVDAVEIIQTEELFR